LHLAYAISLLNPKTDNIVSLGVGRYNKIQLV